MITKVDKGGTVVIVKVKDYIRDGESQLKNKDHYNILKYDPAETDNIK